MLQGLATHCGTRRLALPPPMYMTSRPVVVATTLWLRPPPSTPPSQLWLRPSRWLRPRTRIPGQFHAWVNADRCTMIHKHRPVVAGNA